QTNPLTPSQHSTCTNSICCHFFFVMNRPPLTFTIFPYTTLFRSHLDRVLVAEARREGGLPQADVWLECQRDPVRGGRRDLRRQGNHRRAIEADEPEVAT